ncbi:MAG: LarC family nickel insertion protein [Phycisphaeraceae bacterium]|nr:LarC family nickel insertion protein [Phycisphaeraceae bacterium]
MSVVHLHIDPFAGIAGDMFLGACLDLGADLAAIEAALEPLPIERAYRISAEPTYRHAIRGMDLKVHLLDNPDPAKAHRHDHHHEHEQAHDHHHDGTVPSTGRGHGHTGYRQILRMIDQLETSERAKDRARAIAGRIAEAEAKVHGTDVDHVHFHEVGAVDSIVDMLGSAVALELLGVESLSCGPLPIGHGFVRCDHGNMPLPAPATAQILTEVPHFGVDRIGETVTPTGAAIVAACCRSFGPMPPMKVRRIGYGAGDRDPADVPNLLRLFLGEPVACQPPVV